MATRSLRVRLRSRVDSRGGVFVLGTLRLNGDCGDGTSDNNVCRNDSSAVSFGTKVSLFGVALSSSTHPMGIARCTFGRSCVQINFSKSAVWSLRNFSAIAVTVTLPSISATCGLNLISTWRPFSGDRNGQALTRQSIFTVCLFEKHCLTNSSWGRNINMHAYT